MVEIDERVLVRLAREDARIIMELQELCRSHNDLLKRVALLEDYIAELEQNYG